MSFFGGGGLSLNTSSNTTTSTVEADVSQDRVINNPAEDSVSDICFSPQAEFLSVASWDKKVRIYEVTASGDSEGRAMFEHEGPVLSTHWSPDGTKVVSGGADKVGKLFDLQSQQSTQIAAHDDTIQSVRFVDVGGSNTVVATSSWDKTLKYWDLRQQQPVSTVQLPERAYTMDSSKQLLVVGTAERHVCIIDLTNPQTIFKKTVSPLRWQTRVISCYPTGDGYAVGSIEGRCGVQYINDTEPKKSFSFKCHREVPPNNNRNAETKIYALNAISFHPTYGTLSTAGSDGRINLWDKESKQRLKTFPDLGATVACTAFNRTGSILAYALSYDWSKGISFNRPDYPNIIRLHPCKDEEVKPKPPKSKR